MHKADVFGETAFLWNGDVLLSETRRHWQKLYVYEPDSFRPLALVQNQRVYYYHLDHLGTPQELTDVEGQVVWNVRYRAYGNVVEKEVEQVENNLRFQGQYFDAETGLHYNRFRYYDPQVGQFVQQDPIGLVGGENVYWYVPNPTGWVDPLGLEEEIPYKLSDHNPVPKVIREQYEEIKLGNGTPRIDPSTGKQTIFQAREIKGSRNKHQWKDSLEWDVPGTKHRILQRPDGKLGYVLDHDYSRPRLFPGPWYPDGKTMVRKAKKCK